MVPPSSDRVSRAPPYSIPCRFLPVPACHRLWGAFPDASGSCRQENGLVRVRSPLLAESRLMSFPPATEMFQFAGFASRAYGLSAGSSPQGGGCPIRRSPDQRLLAASRGLSQRATSFIASRRQGIHQMPFVHSRTHHPAPAARPAGGRQKAESRRQNAGKACGSCPLHAVFRPPPASAPLKRAAYPCRTRAPDDSDRPGTAPAFSKSSPPYHVHDRSPAPAPPRPDASGPPTTPVPGRNGGPLRQAAGGATGGPGPIRTADLTLIRGAL